MCLVANSGLPSTELVEVIQQDLCSIPALAAPGGTLGVSDYLFELSGKTAFEGDSP
jgi:hypothetical protein